MTRACWQRQRPDEHHVDVRCLSVRLMVELSGITVADLLPVCGIFAFGTSRMFNSSITKIGMKIGVFFIGIESLDPQVYFLARIRYQHCLDANGGAEPLSRKISA